MKNTQGLIYTIGKRAHKNVVLIMLFAAFRIHQRRGDGLMVVSPLIMLFAVHNNPPMVEYVDSKTRKAVLRTLVEPLREHCCVPFRQ